MASFQFVHEKGFNWGSRIRKLSQRILKLLENGLFLEEKKEGASARKSTREIQGFGSFSQRSSSTDESLKASDFRTWLRCNSNYSHQHNQCRRWTSSWTQTRSFCSRKQYKSTRIPASQPVLGNPVKISREESTARRSSILRQSSSYHSIPSFCLGVNFPNCFPSFLFLMVLEGCERRRLWRYVK
ncbi:hypothetical protein NC651_025941 [Populus alba x Populus x berolinensis]|nr:hypothetical protein NC651_025941 [Populus alba x Populus x berolinensis]